MKKNIKPQTHPLPSKGWETKTQKKNVPNIPLFKGEWPQAKGVLIAGILLLFLILFISLFTNKNQAPEFRKASLLSSWDYQSIQPNSEIIISTKSDRQTGTVNLQYHQSHVEFELPLANSQIKQIAPDKISFVTDKKTIEPQYQVLSNGIKENLILHQIPNTNEFASTIKTSNADLYFNAENLPVFLDSKTKEYLFHIQKPYAFDANGNRTYAVTYQIQGKGGFPYPSLSNSSKSSLPLLSKLTKSDPQKSYTLVLKVDSQWLFDKSRAYPITIDPTIVHDTQSEFASGSYNRIKDTGLGDTAPNLETYYQELSADINTVGLWHMNEASGNVLDSSGNNNTGTPTGTTVTTGMFGNGRSFNGNSDYINGIQIPLRRSSNNEFSISVWFKTDATSSGPIVMFGDSNSLEGSTVADSTIGWINGTGNLSTSIHDGVTGHFYATANNTYRDGQWHNLISVLNSGGLYLYVDGTQVAYNSSVNSKTGQVYTSNPYFWIGRRTKNSSNTIDDIQFFNGTLDELSISNIARTPEEIKASAQRRPYSVYTSPVIDIGTSGTYDWNSISWTESGVATGDGETPYSTDGLVAQWNFNETSGATAVSGGSCGTSCNGTLTNFANTSGQDVGGTNDGWTANNRRWGTGALMFDGVDDYVSVTDNASLAITSAISVEAWVRPTVVTSAASIFNRRTAENVGGITLEFNPSNTTKFYVYVSGAWQSAISQTNAVQPGQWNHIVGTYNGTTLNIYVNGILSGSSSVSGTINNPASSTVWIGKNIPSNLLFQGTIDSTRIYSRALTASEILSNYNAGNVELRTRVGNSTDPNDGTWEEWKPETSETTIDSMDTATIEPSDISGLQVWLKADAISGVSSGTQFGTWTDSSGTGNNFTQTTSTRQPTYSTNVLNGKPVVTFSAGSSQTMTNPINLSSGPNTVIYVVRQTGGANARMLSGLSNNWLLGYWNGGKRQAYFNGWITPHGSPTTDTSWHIYSAVQTGSNSSVWEDGNNFVSSSTAGIAGPNGLSLSGHYATSEFSNGQIAELIVYNKALNDSERIEIENYLANKYQLGLNNGVRYNNDTNIKIEGTGSKKITSGTLEPDGSTVALWHFDETSGSGAYLKDSTSNANHGTPTGTTVVEGFSGKARSFTAGSSDVVSFSPINVGTNYTFESWVNFPIPNNANWRTLFANNGGTYHYAIVQSGTNNLGVYNSSFYPCGWNATSISGWHHLAVVVNSSVSYTQFYLDGSPLCTSATQITNQNFGVIGNYTSSGGVQGMGSAMDEVRFSNIARTPEEIAETYRAGRDHYINKTISSTNLSNKTSLPFYIASDRQGTFLNTTIGESPFANYQPDANTVGLWHFDENNPNTTIETPLNTSGLVGWWHLNEASGNVLDSSGEGFTGVPTGTTVVSGLSSNGRSLNGSSDYITLPNSSTLDPAAITIEAWIKPNVLQTGNFVDKGGNSGYRFRVTGSTVQFLDRGATNYLSSQNNTIVSGVWTHVAVTGDSSGLKMYINGVLNNSNTVAYGSPVTTSSLLFGRYGNSASEYYSGIIDEVRIYNRALSAKEIAADAVTSPISDSSSYSNQGLSYGSQSTQGKLGQTRSFDGISSSVQIADNSSLDGFNYFTVDAWIYPTEQKLQTVIMKPSTGGAGAIYNIELLANGTIRIHLHDNTDANLIDISGSNYPINTWTHLAFVYNNSMGYLYKNGDLVLSQAKMSSNNIENSSNSIYVGVNINARYFKGLIDEVRISNIARTPDEIRQAFEIGARTHNVTIDFKAKLDSGNLIANSSDYSFTIDETAYGSSTKAGHIFLDDKIIIKENINGTEYIAQGTINSVSSSTGAVSVSSWDASSTFPSSGFTVNATVFKWQREYFDITGSLSSHRNSIANLTLRLTDGSMGANIWLDDLRSSGGYLTNSLGSTIPSTLGSRYFQYQVIETSNDTAVSPSVSQVTLDYLVNYYPQTPTFLSPINKANNQAPNVSLKVTAIDIENNSLQYKITLCTDSAMTANCQVFDQTSSQVGWSSQDIGTSAYSSGSTAVFTTPNLIPNTTYYWKSVAIDPDGSNLWGSTQTTPYSFTTALPISPGNCLIEESLDNSFLKIKWINRTSYLDKFFIEKSVDSSSYSPLTTINDIGTTDYTDVNVSKNHTYRYRIAASFLGINSYWCETPFLNLNSIPVPTTLPENGILIF